MSAKRPSAWAAFVASAPTTYPTQYAEFRAANPGKHAVLMNFAKFAREGFAAKDYEALEKSYTAPESSPANINSLLASLASVRSSAVNALSRKKKAVKSARSSAAAANDPAEEAMRIANTIQDELEHLKSVLGRLRGGTRKRRSLRNRR
jgi:hypothetical protein